MADINTPRPVEKWAQVNGLDMRYLDWGGDGEPLLALHGLASSAHWYDIVARLLRHRYRIIAPDQRGHGQTTQAPTGYDWHTLSDDLAALLGRDPLAMRGRGLQAHEDQLDALLGAYVAAHVWHWSAERNWHLGSAETGSSVLPMIRPDVDHSPAP